MSQRGKPSPLEVLQTESSSDDSCMTFVLNGEDHTLGNSLRYMIMKNPKVEFCGYAVPHPSESKINLRIQTYGSSAVEQFQKGLEDLDSMCQVILNKFQQSMEYYKESHREETMQDD